jgi:hypothetical protein
VKSGEGLKNVRDFFLPVFEGKLTEKGKGSKRNMHEMMEYWGGIMLLRIISFACFVELRFVCILIEIWL